MPWKKESSFLACKEQILMLANLRRSIQEILTDNKKSSKLSKMFLDETVKQSLLYFEIHLWSKCKFLSVLCLLYDQKKEGTVVY